MFRRFICGLILFLSCLSFITAMAEDSAVVLMYHRFGEDRYPETNIKVEQFKAQLELLKNEGFSVIPLADLLKALTHSKSLPPKSVVVTIDDAYRSIYKVAYPMLQKYGFPFTVFVATDPVDNGLPAYINWVQMREMAGTGVTFANHGASHCSAIKRLKHESDSDRITRVMADFEKGRIRLAQELEPLPNVFAYPYGEYDSKVAGLLLKEGYFSFGQQSGAVGPRSDLRSLPRFPVAEAFAEIGEFRVKINSLPMPVKAVKPWDPVVNNTRPEIEITLGKKLARVNELACFVSGQGRVPVRWIEEGKRFAVRPQRDLGEGRQRVNCTIPRNDGRYFWFSHPWFVNTNNP